MAKKSSVRQAEPSGGQTPQRPACQSVTVESVAADLFTRAYQSHGSNFDASHIAEQAIKAAETFIEVLHR